MMIKGLMVDGVEVMEESVEGKGKREEDERWAGP